MASEASRFGYGCVVYVGVDVRAGDVKVDVIYIAFIISAQCAGYLVPYKDKVQAGKCTTGQRVLVRCSDRGVLNPSPYEVTDIYRCQLLRICDDTKSMLTSSQTPLRSEPMCFTRLCTPYL